MKHPIPVDYTRCDDAALGEEEREEEVGGAGADLDYIMDKRIVSVSGPATRRTRRGGWRGWTHDEHGGIYRGSPRLKRMKVPIEKSSIGASSFSSFEEIDNVTLPARHGTITATAEKQWVARSTFLNGPAQAGTPYTSDVMVSDSYSERHSHWTWAASNQELNAYGGKQRMPSAGRYHCIARAVCRLGAAKEKKRRDTEIPGQPWVRGEGAEGSVSPENSSSANSDPSLRRCTRDLEGKIFHRLVGGAREDVDDYLCTRLCKDEFKQRIHGRMDSLPGSRP
ncbi:hypothetical protein B0H11DRAFT_1906343 [Mycena galericulata]|nr:hypothetical protein B0H11DRAFT_1906343 [Mycena galericulata]